MRILWILALLGVLVLSLEGGVPGWAQTEENPNFALFYEALAPYGKWIDYGKYGPVWYPAGVSDDWRPYLDGRWVPTEEGWVFETEEPWGWAAYHYGNWFPTIEYGWVWSPGSTWYPSTVVWRTSDEYIGWAPLPPPDYEPVPAFYPEGGYYPGAPLWDLLTPPFWTFCPAASFLLGFGQPFSPAFSYWNCGCLTPFLLNPFLAFRTYFLPDFFFPFFAPNGCFAFGPPFPFIARVANINVIVINRFAQEVRFDHLKNVVPPKVVLDRHPFLRKVVPDPVLKGERFAITPVKDPKLAESHLLRPDAVPLPAGIPKTSTEIPKAIALPYRTRVGPQALAGVKGMSLPEKAVSRKAAAVPTLQPSLAAPPETQKGPARLKARSEAGARMIEVQPPARRGEAFRERPGPPQEQLRILERRQQQIMEGQRQQMEQLRQRQLRQQEVFREQQRLLEQYQMRQRETLRRQQDQLRQRLEWQQRQQQQIRPPSPPIRSAPESLQFRFPAGSRSFPAGAVRSGGMGPRGSPQGTSPGGFGGAFGGRGSEGSLRVPVSGGEAAN